MKSVESQKDIEQFAKIGVEFSKKYPNGIPRFLSSEINNFDKEENYFLRIGGKLKAFIHSENGFSNGRIAAMIHPEHPETGLIGLFDCIENESIAFELIETAIAWLRENGCKKIVGPVDFSIYRSYRFMTKGFEEKSFVGEPRNLLYYPQFFEKFGFKRMNFWESLFLDKSGIETFLLENKLHSDIFDQLGYSTEKLNGKNKLELMRKTYRILISAYKVFPLFTSISEEDFLKEFARMPDLILRDCSLFVYNPSGEFLGFLLVMKDLTIALQKMNGKTDFWAKLRFLLNQHKTSMANVSQGATIPYFIREAAVLGKKNAGQSFSIASAITYKVLKLTQENKGYKSAIVSLVRDEGQMRNHVDKPYKRREYGLYEYDLI